LSKVLKLAVVGVGRIGSFHARHVAELAARGGSCRLAALVDPRPDLSEVGDRLGQIQGTVPKTFAALDALLAGEDVDAAIIASPTALHRLHAQTLIRAGCRVLVEKPLTENIVEERAFAVQLERDHPQALMLAFQRRFDEALVYAKGLLDSGCIGRPFKYVSVLEDSSLMPEGYESPGLLQDMSVHNVDEVLWLSGGEPARVRATGARLYSHRISPVEEDFDDAQLDIAFEDESHARVQVSRNHVAGYRVESWIYGEDGVIHAGRFMQRPSEVHVEAYGRSGVIAERSFSTRDYGVSVPEFIGRFGDAYAAEVEVFVRCCRDGLSFPVHHGQGLAAMEVIAEGVASMPD